ncbi:hypothetical protein, partial [Paraburkholderia sp. NMBU_R16]|uniref:hypothetical protein n=1 Tax=Paraburkholderia sp. NMBU_R16 TaxID=2698676 RepID=UPI001C260B46
NMRRASINKRLSASINIGIINLAATFSSCLSRVSHPDCRATAQNRLISAHIGSISAHIGSKSAHF